MSIDIIMLMYQDIIVEETTENVMGAATGPGGGVGPEFGGGYGPKCRKRCSFTLVLKPKYDRLKLLKLTEGEQVESFSVRGSDYDYRCLG